MKSAEERTGTLVHGTKTGNGRLGPAVQGPYQAPLWPPFLMGQHQHPVRVVVVDDDPHMRDEIARELEADQRIDLVAQAGSARDGKRAIAAHAFDVLLVDLRLRDGSGFELIEYVKRARPNAEAVVVTVMEDDESALQAFELGATGYLIKSSWFGNFAQAVLQVVNGGAAITPTLARRLLKRLDGSAAPSSKKARSGRASGGKLSAREREILQLVATGYTSCEIGKRLVISNQTVDTHLKNVFRKLEVRSRAQAVHRATDWGVLYE
jgi:DNA-binding NarL/FixJ family response regulator